MSAVLDNYLKLKKGGAAKLSKLTGITPPAISRMKNGRLEVTLRSAMLMEVATDGELKAEQLLVKQDEIELVKAFRGRQ